MSSFASLEIGKRALAAQKLGLDVTSNNIANVNTPGYSRRLPVMKETNPRLTASGFLGTGVIMDNLRNFREEFFDREIRTNLGRKTGFETDEKIINRLETILAEPSENGLNEVISNFFNSFEDLANKPENIGLRNHVIELAKTLVDRFHSTSAQLSDTRNEIKTGIYENVNIINRLISDVASLNNQIASSKSLSGSEVQTYIDQREQILEQLSEIAGVQITQGQSGAVNVFINGINVVSGFSASTLKVIENINPNNSEKTINIATVDNNNNVLNYVNVASGELSSLVKHYNITFDDMESSSGFSIAKKLDELAAAIVTKVNELTNTGYGLDDTGPNPPGRNFFEPSLTNATAATIEISAEILNKPRNIPISNAPNEPGNNSVAIGLARLSSLSSFIDGSTYGEYYSNLLAKIGSLGTEAANGNNATKLIAQQLNNQRESVIGVNLDEEAVSLIKYQKAFEASARIISSVNDLLGTIINLGR